MLGRLRDGVLQREQRVDELAMRLGSAWERRERGWGARLAGLEVRLRRQEPTVRLGVLQRRYGLAEERLARVRHAVVSARRVRVERAVVRLGGLSPLAVLGRGYAIVYGDDGAIVRDAGEVRAGEVVTARVGVGGTAGKGGGIDGYRLVEGDVLMKKLFGTDGIRGVAGVAPLDEATVYAVGRALAVTLEGKKVLLGMDTRESSASIAATLTAGLMAGGG